MAVGEDGWRTHVAAAQVGMPSEPHRPTAAIRRVINPDAPARRQFASPVRDDGHDQTFRTGGEHDRDVASDLARLAASQGTGEAWPSVADVKIVAIGNAKVKGSPDRHLA